MSAHVELVIKPSSEGILPRVAKISTDGDEYNDKNSVVVQCARSSHDKPGKVFET